VRHWQELERSPTFERTARRLTLIAEAPMALQAWHLSTPPAFLAATLLALAAARPAQAQNVELAAFGGIHAARLNRPERTLDQPARGVSLQSAPGEATAMGFRVSAPLSGAWRWDVGLVWSRNRSAVGGFGRVAPDFETNTIFTSATVRARLTPGASRFALAAGAGPALVLHEGSGTSLLSRQADLGAVLSLAGTMNLDGRMGIRIDAQEYLFSSTFRDSYAPSFTGGAAAQPAGPQFRHEFVILAGLSWLAL
jgi:hypothetical protein